MPRNVFGLKQRKLISMTLTGILFSNAPYLDATRDSEAFHMVMQSNASARGRRAKVAFNRNTSFDSLVQKSSLHKSTTFFFLRKRQPTAAFLFVIFWPSRFFFNVFIK